MSVEDLFAEVAAAHPRCVWLDGGGAREWSGTRSLIGWLEDDDVSLTYSAARREVLRHTGGRSEVVGDDIWEALEREVGPGEQWFGYLGYACRTDLPAAPSQDVPDAVWMRPSHIRLFEHELLGQSLHFSGVAMPEKCSDTRLTGYPSPPSPAYRAAFAQIQEALHAGDTYEANLTYRTTVEAEADPVTTYLRLRSINPAPYAGFLQHAVAGHAAWLLSSSPERYAVIDEDRTIETRPIKGTTPRGATVEEDAANAELLRTDPKLRSENLMITDLLRNDLAMVCEPGTVAVPGLMQVESYETVHQLVTTVRGRLSDGITTIEALRRLFPAGSMTGAPKLRTMEVIERAERDLGGPRAAYAGAFGWISGDGPADLGVVIRTLTTHDTRTWRIGTGGGITVRSDVDAEAAEARLKADRVRASLGR
ncbi:anthranilate synthase component I family protein [Nocardioides sp. KC13]|uniref:Anthranilate synthase component I family protein n=1 Tax=Nocardioides turkmenicus TaxID=2711220 RepID=A0A6M1R3H6_9ACTN|nr:anthranilate synthase component I family protein [Nocardioides sp. KC13]